MPEAVHKLRPAPDAATELPEVLRWVRGVLAGSPDDALREELTLLDPLARQFALAPVDEDLLLFALAHRVDGTVAALCAEAAGDPRQTYVTPHLLTRLRGGSAPEFAAALFDRLAPGAPLRRWALIEMRETHALAAISLPEELALRLTGGGAPMCPPGCLPLAPVPGLARVDTLAAELAPQLARGVALIGPAGSGRRALVAAMAAQVGCGAVLLEPGRVPGDEAGRDAVLRAVAREARLDGLVVALEVEGDAVARRMLPGEEDGTAARAGVSGRRLAEAAARIFGGGLVLLAEVPTGLPDGFLRETLPPFDAPERRVLWQAALREPVSDGELDAVAQHFPYGPAEIAEIAASLSPGDPPGTLWRRCRGRGGRGLEALARRIVPRVGWKDLILPEPVTRELAAIADQIRHRARVYDEWGFGGRMPSGRGVTALLAGPSGVGKTMAAEVLAGELGLDLYKVDLSRLISKYIGETEKNLRRVFDAAEETGACLFLDEADACLGKRSEVKDSHDRHANIEVSYLLQRIESYSGLCLLATNLKNNIDTAFLRRLRFVIDLQLPDQGERLRIWERAFPPETPTQGLDMVALSRLDISGGSIVVIAVNAAFLAASESRPVTMGDIARAARGEYRKHDRAFRAPWVEGA
ncbi:MAG: AAA family ATPase [Salipiger thiooxidans]|uniref:AAA family ATPase n=1 Tax=Salipiger thiooxidans TaxID=282683 RepID=UPI001CF9315D|nr:ATP-binding protein [Salipiger thiooxidans]